MARNLSSLRSAHLVMWSSPLLLLVLVFTLTTNSTPPTRLVIERVGATTTTTVTTRTPATSVKVHTVPTTPAASTAHATTTTPAKVTTKATTKATNPVAKTQYVDATSLTAKSPAPAPKVSVSSGVLSGVLSPDFNVADLPLQGPGSWTLLTSAPVRAQLQCASTVITVVTQVIVNAAQSCQLQLTSNSPEVSPTWQLTPAA